MRKLIGLVLTVAACSDDGAGAIDATAPDADLDGAPADAVDAAVDAVELDACATRTLFMGGVAPGAQGWSVVQQQPSSVLMPTATTTVLTSSTAVGATTGGQVLLTLPGATLPFTIEVTLRVEAVDNHNLSDAAVAIMGSFTPPFGLPAERSQMIYIDGNRLGFADNSGQFAANALDGSFHTYRVEVDALGNLRVHRDGTLALERAGYTTNGTIAIGDQTNDANVDATITIQSVTLLCQP